MKKDITLKEALELVEFEYVIRLKQWRVAAVQDNVYGDVHGNVEGDVEGNVLGNVYGTINSIPWQYVETPMERLKRLIKESGDKTLIEALSQLEDNL